MHPQIRRCAALLGVAAGFAFAAPAQAHHIQTCPGFNDPACNVNYFKAHQVDPAVAPVIGAVEYQKRFVEDFIAWCQSEGFDYCLTWQVDRYVMPLLDPALKPIRDLLAQIQGEFNALACEYFGACG